jgi:acyl-homoserine-lactone acylase
MFRLVSFLTVVSFACSGQPFSAQEINRWQSQAAGITVTRDVWGVPHISGKTDADAVFGMLYTQCEDDFPRVERNYLAATARLAEVEGEHLIFNDLRQRLFLDTLQAIEAYKASPDWLKKLCHGFADGANYFLHTHPDVKPKRIRRFEPWMPLLFSEGSIGGDIESVSLNDLKRFYGKGTANIKQDVSDDGNGDGEPRGSNGFAIAPSRSANGNALFLINPHTSFYFRSELQVTSEEGLNAYGAVTWGQFFVYQGFNNHCGWMHTSSAADVIDEYKEKVTKKGSKYVYAFGTEERPVTIKKISIRFKTDKGMARREFTAYFTHHGPVTAEREGAWITTRLMVEPAKALQQSFIRTKASGFEDYKKGMDLLTNSSNNTVFADDKGNIAYWHGNFMPRRNAKFDWSKAVDGSDPASDWQGLHTVDETIHIYNPGSGWIQNCNSTPFTVSGPGSPDKSKYPTYMAPDGENPRGLHAVKVLTDEPNFTMEKLIAAAYDPYLPGFEILLPALLKGYDAVAATNDTLKANYAEPIQLLRSWDLKWSAGSVPTTIAVYWGQALRQKVLTRLPGNQLEQIQYMANSTNDTEKVAALASAIAGLKKDFGAWKQAWGAVNRFQRLTPGIESAFDDAAPSIGVQFTGAYWGSLASFAARRYPNTKRMYGTSGNSFVAVVEFGRKVRAKSVVTGGSSGNPSSKHFNDQSQMYATGQFKDVLFYPDDYRRNAERTYHPGDKTP